MLDLMQQELDFSRGEALTLASLTVDLIRRPAFTYRSSSVPGKPRNLHCAVTAAALLRFTTFCCWQLEKEAHDKRTTNESSDHRCNYFAFLAGTQL